MIAEAYPDAKGRLEESGEVGVEVPEAVTVEVEDIHPLPEVSFIKQHTSMFTFAFCFVIKGNWWPRYLSISFFPITEQNIWFYLQYLLTLINSLFLIDIIILVSLLSSGFSWREGGFSAFCISVWNHHDGPVCWNQADDFWTLYRLEECFFVQEMISAVTQGILFLDDNVIFKQVPLEQ